MDESCVTVQVDGQVALVTIDNPPVNALSQHVKVALADAFDGLGSRDDVWVIILTGAGETFMAGADIKQLVGITRRGAGDRIAHTRALFDGIGASPQPVVCAIEGPALGGGLELALVCDIRIAGRSARLGLPEVRLGLMPGAGGTQRLPRLVGATVAKELIFTGATINAEEARCIGLVNKVVDDGQAVDEARRMAERICSNGPVAVRTAKQAIDRGLQLPLAQGIDLEGQLWVELCDTDDMHEGLRAFVEKRRPRYGGK